MKAAYHGRGIPRNNKNM